MPTYTKVTEVVGAYLGECCGHRGIATPNPDDLAEGYVLMAADGVRYLDEFSPPEATGAAGADPDGMPLPVRGRFRITVEFTPDGEEDERVSLAGLMKPEDLAKLQEDVSKAYEADLSAKPPNIRTAILDGSWDITPEESDGADT